MCESDSCSNSISSLRNDVYRDNKVIFVSSLSSSLRCTLTLLVFHAHELGSLLKRGNERQLLIRKQSEVKEFHEDLTISYTGDE